MTAPLLYAAGNLLVMNYYLFQCQKIVKKCIVPIHFYL